MFVKPKNLQLLLVVLCVEVCDTEYCIFIAIYLFILC